MTTRLSDGQSFSTVRGGIHYGDSAPNIYVSHNKGDKSGFSLLTSDDKVLLELSGGDVRLMTYDTMRGLHAHLGNMLAQYDLHREQARKLEAEQKERVYQQELNAWKDSMRENSLNTISAVEALMQGKTIRLLENVLSNSNGGFWEEYKVDTDGQVMVSTATNRTPHLASYGPLSKWAKDKRWVIVPFTAPPVRK